MNQTRRTFITTALAGAAATAIAPLAPAQNSRAGNPATTTPGTPPAPPVPDWQQRFALTPGNPPNDGILFADLQPQGRGGHMGHALVEYAPGRILGFYPNCNADNNGHSGNGWMEFRRSVDGGKTWGEPEPLPYSKQLYDSQTGRTAMCEKAIMTPDGQILLFLLHCDMQTTNSGKPELLSLWEPYFEPAYIKSRDGGLTWSEPKMFTKECGRVYDLLYKDGVIYLLLHASAERSDARLKNSPYQLYVSQDNGETFTLRSRLPLGNTKSSFYGTMEFFPSGRLIACVYDQNDEHNLKYTLSDDEGRTWQPATRRAFFAKRIRNPQLVRFGDEYFMHGRSGQGRDKMSGNFILYHSLDGIHWDEGTFLRMREAGTGSYSNNIVVGGRFPGEKQRLLIHTSHAYKNHLTNTIMWWLDKK